MADLRKCREKRKETETLVLNTLETNEKGKKRKGGVAVIEEKYGKRSVRSIECAELDEGEVDEEELNDPCLSDESGFE